MKKRRLAVVALLLCLCTLFSACKSKDTPDLTEHPIDVEAASGIWASYETWKVYHVFNDGTITMYDLETGIFEYTAVLDGSYVTEGKKMIARFPGDLRIEITLVSQNQKMVVYEDRNYTTYSKITQLPTEVQKVTFPNFADERYRELLSDITLPDVGPDWLACRSKAKKALIDEIGSGKVTHGTAKTGDYVIIYFSASNDDGKYVNVGASGAKLCLTPSGSFLDQFIDYTIGKSTGDEYDADVTMPANFSDVDYANKILHFHCQLSSIFDPADLDEDDLRALTNKNAGEDVWSKICDEIFDEFEFEPTDYEYFYVAYQRRFQKMANLSTRGYDPLSSDYEDYCFENDITEEKIAENSKKYLIRFMLADYLFEKEQLTVSEEDKEEALEQLIENFDAAENFVDNDEAEAYVRNNEPEYLCEREKYCAVTRWLLEQHPEDDFLT